MNLELDHSLEIINLKHKLSIVENVVVEVKKVATILKARAEDNAVTIATLREEVKAFSSKVEANAAKLIKLQQVAKREFYEARLEAELNASRKYWELQLQ